MRNIRLQLCLLLLLVLGAGNVEAHRFVATNLDAQFTLTDEELRNEVTVATFLLEPLSQVVSMDDAADTPALRHSLEEFFHAECPVRIDGILVRPGVSALDFVQQVGMPHLDIAERDFVTATITLAYSLKTKPRQIAMLWGLYPEPPPAGWSGIVDPDQDATELILMMDVYGNPDYIFFHPDEPEFIWHGKGDGISVSATQPAVLPVSKLRISLVSLVAVAIAVGVLVASRSKRKGSALLRWGMMLGLCAAALGGRNLGVIEVSHPFPGQPKMPGEEEALAVFESLQANVYRAFDYQLEEEVYDALAQSVEGPMLEDLYLEIFESLILRYNGGAVCKVAKVAIQDASIIEMVEGPSIHESLINLGCRWQVDGVVEHWGHLHRRVNEYEAEFTLGCSEGTWKIADMQVTAQKRVGGRSTVE